MANRIKGITIEIGGDTTGLEQALKSVNKEIKNTQSELKDVNKLLKLDPGNTELLSQKHKLLGQSIEETKTKLESLKEAAAKADDALANGEISQSQYDALQREIIETEQDLKSLTEQYKEFGSVSTQQMAEAGKKMQETGDKISSAGQKLLPATAAVAGLGTAAVATASNFESSMSQVQATMGITKDAMSEVDGQSVNTMDALSDLAKQMGAETAFSASECADALNYLALAGYDTQQMCDTLPTVLNLAAAGGIDLAQASDMVTDAMSALGMDTSEATVMVDQMAKTASTTNTSVAQLGEGILTIGATAKSVKGGTAELNTALGILANNGIKSAEGGTHLRNIILSLQTPTNQASKLFNELGVNVFDSNGKMRSLNDILGELNTSMEGMTDAEKANIIGTIFNKTDLAAVNSLLANTGEEWNNIQSAIENSGGAAGQMAATQLDNLEGQITLLKSSLESLGISFGEILLPYIKAVVDGLQGFINWLNGLSEPAQRVIVVVGLIVAALGPVLIFVGKIISSVGAILTIMPKISAAIGLVKGAFSALGTAMLANPIGIIIAAITALVAAFIYLWNNCEGFREFWINLWEGIKEIAITVWTAISEFFTTIWTAIGEFFRSIWEGIKNVFQTVVDWIYENIVLKFMAVFEFLQAIHETIWNTLTNIWTTIWNTITSIVTGIWNTIQSIWQAITGFIISAATSIWGGVTDIFNGMWKGITSIMGGIKEAIVGILNSAVDFIKGLIHSAFSWGADLIGGMINGIKSMAGRIADAARGIASKVRSILHFTRPDEGPLRDYETWMPHFMQGLADGINKSRGLVADAMQNVASDMVVNPMINSPTMATAEGTYLATSGTLSAVKGLVDNLSVQNTGTNGDLIIPVYIGQERINEIVIKANQINNFRSGGR